MSSTIAFPGLGIGEFTIDRVAFTVFGKEIYWYGVIISFAMLVAVGYVMWRTREYKGIKIDDIIDFALFIIIFGVIGARLYYVIFDPTPNYDSIIDVIAIWEGGLGIYGGIIAGGVTAMVVCRVKKIRIPCFLDMLAPAVMIAQAIGRWANFCNGEAFGGVTDSIFGMQLNNHLTGYQTVIVHPTFLYESLWNIAGFILLNVLYRKRKFDGQIVLGYLAWYGFGRMFIEGLRTDSLYIGPIRVSQLVGLLCFVLATAAMVYFWFIKKAPRYAIARYKLDATEENVEMALNDIETALTGAIEDLKASDDNTVELKNKNESTEEKSSPVADENEVKDKKENENGTDN